MPLLFGLGASSSGHAARSGAPVLMLETGTHAGMVNRIAADHAGRYLVSASNDKTARVWDVATGKLVAVLRPPVGAEKEGLLYAAAISPDGSRVALGGWISDGQGYRVLIFDRAGGKPTQHIAGLPQVVLHLEFSADGRYLAVAMAERGWRVYDARSARLLAADAALHSGVEFAEFSRSGDKLVVTAHDGSVRLYRFADGVVSLLARKVLTGGQMPRAARFSPDGKKIAVGFDDSTVVNLVDGETLEPLVSPQTPITGGTLSSVAWSGDGSVLYAAGEWSAPEGYMLRKWHDAGNGTYADIAMGKGPIVDLRTLPGGALAYATKAGVVGLVDAGGNVRRFGDDGIARFVSDRQSFRISARGERVQVRLHGDGERPFVFNAATGALAAGVDPDLAAPRLEAPGMSLGRWENGEALRLNGRPLSIKQGDTVRAVAISPDAALVAIGAEWSIYAFGRTGKSLWKQPVAAAVIGLNVSGDGRYLVAMLDDGTLRWLRAADGREALRVFLHADRRRWLAWTPAGDYDASPGAEALFGWYVHNDRASEPDFFPAAAFRSSYYKPGLAQQVLRIEPPKPEPLAAVPTAAPSPVPKPVEASAAVAPAVPTVSTPAAPFSGIVGGVRPTLRILSPANDAAIASQEIVVRYAIESPAGVPVKAIYAVVNDRTVTFPVTRNLEVAPTQGHEIRLSLPPADSEIMIFAENANGLGPPAVLRLKWGGAGK